MTFEYQAQSAARTPDPFGRGAGPEDNGPGLVTQRTDSAPSTPFPVLRAPYDVRSASLAGVVPGIRERRSEAVLSTGAEFRTGT
jgi:hypothetical protein